MERAVATPLHSWGGPGETLASCTLPANEERENGKAKKEGDIKEAHAS